MPPFFYTTQFLVFIMTPVNNMWRNKNANTAFKMPVGDIKLVNIALTQEFCKITLWSSEISSKCNICNSLI